LRHSNEVKIFYCFQLIHSLIYSIAFNKDLEKEVSSRVRGTDFKRMLISALQVEKFVYFKFINIVRSFKANRDELSPQQIQQARQTGIESVIDR
jgi:hypothetical protein